MATRFLWLDLEMSGLEPSECRILEAAAIVTDEKFQELGSFERIVKQPDFVLEAMDAWCTETHGKSGLTQSVRDSKTNDELVERDFLFFLGQFFSADEKIILCGNSIGQDRKFLDAKWKKISARLHYRMVDVTAFKVVFQETLGVKYPKTGAHRALEDIRESIAELKFYLGKLKP